MPIALQKYISVISRSVTVLWLANCDPSHRRRMSPAKKINPAAIGVSTKSRYLIAREVTSETSVVFILP